jgi:hypothetical protein
MIETNYSKWTEVLNEIQTPVQRLIPQPILDIILQDRAIAWRLNQLENRWKFYAYWLDFELNSSTLLREYESPLNIPEVRIHRFMAQFFKAVYELAEAACIFTENFNGAYSSPMQLWGEILGDIKIRQARSAIRSGKPKYLKRELVEGGRKGFEKLQDREDLNWKEVSKISVHLGMLIETVLDLIKSESAREIGAELIEGKDWELEEQEFNQKKQPLIDEYWKFVKAWQKCLNTIHKQKGLVVTWSENGVVMQQKGRHARAVPFGKGRPRGRPKKGVRYNSKIIES